MHLSLLSAGRNEDGVVIGFTDCRIAIKLLEERNEGHAQRRLCTETVIAIERRTQGYDPCDKMVSHITCIILFIHGSLLGEKSLRMETRVLNAIESLALITSSMVIENLR